MKTKTMWLMGLSAICAALLTGCPTTGVVCQPGTERCGDGCADFKSDSRNCGGCGLACQPNQVCQDSACTCTEGTTACGNKCVVTSSDPQNCGGCGNACSGNDVCDFSPSAGSASCRPFCSPESLDAGTCAACSDPAATLCDRSCAVLDRDSDHCGACNNQCTDGRVCRDGTCIFFDVVVACRNFGQVRGLRVSDAGTFTGPLTSLGTTPNALGRYEDVLLVSDDTDRRLLQANTGTLAQLFKGDGGATSVDIGNAPNQVYVDPPYVYVPNSLTNTLQIIELEALLEDGGIPPPPPSPIHGGGGHPNGLGLKTVFELNFGANTNPTGVVVLGETAYVTLYGGFGAAASGQKIARVNTTDAGTFDTLDLMTLDMQAFDGGTAWPNPFAITSFGGKIYAALNNLDDDFQPAGPPLLAQYDPAAGALTTVELGADKCLNASSFAQTADTLFVGCTGKSVFDPGFVLLAVEKAGVVALGRDTPTGPLVVKGSWQPTCPANTTCEPPSIGRIAVSGRRLFVADQGHGRLWVLEHADGVLTEATSTSTPLQACPPTDSTHPHSNVSDVLPMQ